MSQGMLLSIKRLSISNPDRCLFSDLSLSISRGETVSLIGPNGSGKTTLLRHILSREDPAAEENSRRSRDMLIEGQVSIADHLLLASLDQRVTASSIIPEPANRNSNRGLHKLLEEFGLIENVEDPAILSAGMLQKLAIAKLFALQADLYLLDEPSNYLDLPGIVALEHHVMRLSNAGSGFLIVTHDREFSDRVSDHTVFVAPQGIYQTVGGASAAIDLKDREVSARAHQAEILNRKIKQLEEDCRTKAGWAKQKEQSKRGSGGAKGYISHRSAKMARRAKAVQKRIDRKRDDLEQAKPFVPKHVNLSLPHREVPRRTVFHLDGCSFRYSESFSGLREGCSEMVLEGVSFGASTNDKVCLMGGNGAGKSTLLRLAIGELTPLSGEAYRNHNVTICSIPQGLAGYFDRDRLFDNFVFPSLTESVIRQYLGAALLRREMVLRSITELSQGELARAALVHAILGRADFLVMDEPTSHLDLESVIVLEDLLSSFSGGFLIVSHDRAFVSNIAGRLYYVEDSRVRLA